MLNPQKIKQDFPILSREINGHPLVYLDNAATTQKPKQVIEALKNFYENHNANVHRGVHTLSSEATDMMEKTREHTAKFIGAKSPNQIIFTKNATESINLVMYASPMFQSGQVAEKHLKNDNDEEIIVSQLEHHSNLVPWQILANHRNAKLKVIPLKEDHTLDFEEYKKLFTEKTKFVALSGMSNTLGTAPDIKKYIDYANSKNVPILIDATQLVAHNAVNMQDLNPDFLVFSAHKMLGPTGVGILYINEKHLDKMHPFMYGGDMIKNVHQFEADFADSPARFEAGTPNFADIAAFDEALIYLENIGMHHISQHEQKLLSLAREIFSKYPQVTLFGPENIHQSGGILSFNIDGTHAHDVASIFDNHGIAIRSGHHCTQPLMEHLKVPATARVSFYIYNDESDIEKCEDAIKDVIETFKI